MNESADREFISRQAGFLHARGGEPADQLIEVLGSDAAARVNEVLTGGSNLPTTPLLARVVGTLEESGTSPARARAAANRLQNQTDGLLEHATNVFQGVLTYLTMLAVIMALVLLLFVSTVLPSFGQIYVGFGASLPELTTFVTSPVGHIVLLATPFVIVVFLWVLLLRGRAVLSLRRNPGGWLLALPVVGAPFRAFRSWLQIMIADVLLDSGETADNLDQQVRAAVGYDISARTRPAIDCIEMAHRLDTRAEEVDYWRTRYDNDILKGFARARDVLSLLVQLVLGAVVALLVISIYLPLFALGSVL